MPTVSENWDAKKVRQDAIIEAFIQGDDSPDVLRARLFGLGLRSDYLAAEVFQATGRRQARLAALNKEPLFRVLVFEQGREPQVIRFMNSEAAENAIHLLRKQPNVQLASRTFGDQHGMA
jgi:hypothetical protein